jgi:hypothetical protein
MRRRYFLPTALALAAAGLGLPLWKPKTAFAQPDSPIVVGDSGSIHFRRIVAGDVIRPSGARWTVNENGRSSASIEIASAGRTINLTAGWSVKLMDGTTQAGTVASSDNRTVTIDPEGHATPGGTAAEVVIPNLHLRSIVLQNATGGGTFSCPAGGECFRIHYHQ